MDEKEFVSVIITTYGYPKKLERAINSVLNQTYEAIEVIVVDDNDPSSSAREETELLMKNLGRRDRVIYLQHEKNKNGAAARNTGIEAAKGQYIAFLDNDDVYLPDRVQKSVDFLERNSDIDGVLTSVILSEKGFPTAKVTPNADNNICRRLLCGKESLGTGSNLFFRRDVVEKTGLFDVRFLRYQDVEYFLRVAFEHRIGLINEAFIIKESLPGKLPDYKKMKEMTALFLEKFEYMIRQMPEEEQRECYRFHQTNLLKWAIQSNDENGMDLEYKELCNKNLAGEYQHNLYASRKRQSARFSLVKALKRVWLSRTALLMLRKCMVRRKSKKGFSRLERNMVKTALRLC